MKKAILFLIIILMLAAIGWFGYQRFFAPKDEAAASGAESEGGVSGNSAVAENAGADGGADGDVYSAEGADGMQQAETELFADVEGLLYAIRTSAGRDLGMVPIVNGNAVILMDGGSATTHQGEYVGEVQGDFQAKLEEQTALAVSEGKVGAWAFYREAAMKDFAFPEGVSAVEKFAFARSGLTDIVIPEGVTSIGSGAFYHCDALTGVTIPGSVTEIGENAFAHTPWLENWMAGGAAAPSEGTENAEASNPSDTGDFLIVGDGILLAYRGTEAEPALPPEVKSIAPGAIGEKDTVSGNNF